jgi:hypothetical protein
VKENKTNIIMGLSLPKKNNNLSSNPNLTPVVVYENAKLQKKQIMAENKGKSGIYC